MDFVKIKGKKVPRTALAYAVFSLAAMLIVVGVAIVPNALRLTKLEKAIDENGREIERQMAMQPVYARLQKIIKDGEAGGMAEVKDGKLPPARVSVLREVFAPCAEQSGAVLWAVDPEPGSLGKGKSLAVRVKATGDPEQLRAFAAAVCRLPFLEKVESLTVSGRPEGGELNLKVWTALE